MEEGPSFLGKMKKDPIPAIGELNLKMNYI
jgi:hypothetical protein